MEQAEIKEMVRARYGSIAEAASAEAGCCAPTTSCCGPTETPDAKSMRMGYSAEELASVPEGANLGLGCGNPQAIAAIKPGRPWSTSAVAPASTACSPRGRLAPMAMSSAST
jgi:hypothetical protein